MTGTPHIAYISGVVKRHGGPPIEVHQTADLDEHVALIAQQVARSCKDPEVRQLAMKIVNGKPDHWVVRNGRRWPVVDAWGESFLLPHTNCKARDAWCEIQAIWNFVVLNIRYVYDPPDYDLFCTVEYTLKAGGGDCDDSCIVFASLLKCLGFSGVGCRIVTTTGASWEHVYALVALEKDNPSTWIPLDATVDGVLPGWEYPNPLDHRDFYL